MKNALIYPIKNHTPLVVESYRKVMYMGVIYTRRLRISGLNACLIDEALGTFIYKQRTKFVILDLPDIKKACQLLGIDFKPMNTYFHIDGNMCSFSEIYPLST